MRTCREDVQGSFKQACSDVQPGSLIGQTVVLKIGAEPCIESGICCLRKLFVDTLASGPLEDMGVNLVPQWCGEYRLRAHDGISHTTVSIKAIAGSGIGLKCVVYSKPRPVFGLWKNAATIAVSRNLFSAKRDLVPVETLNFCEAQADCHRLVASRQN